MASGSFYTSGTNKTTTWTIGWGWGGGVKDVKMLEKNSLYSKSLYLCLTVTLPFVTKRPDDVNRKSPQTGTVPWATATQPPHQGGASWTAVPILCGSGSPKGVGAGGWAELVGQQQMEEKRWKRFDWGKNDSRLIVERRHWRQTDGHMYVLCTLFCAYMNHIVI